MSRLVYPLTLLLTVGCAPETDHHVEEDVAVLRQSLPGINQRCVDVFRRGGIAAIPQDVRKCFPMESSKRWRGLWFDEFEGSRFCAAPADECTFDTEGERVWLHFADEISDSVKPNRLGTNILYEIEFVGRQTSRKGAFGHMGGSDREMVVEELISLNSVPSN